MKREKNGSPGKVSRQGVQEPSPGRSYEEQWAGITLPTHREKQRLLKALQNLKDATQLDARMAMILLEINGLDNALEFIAQLDQARRWDPLPFRNMRAC